MQYYFSLGASSRANAMIEQPGNHLTGSCTQSYAHRCCTYLYLLLSLCIVSARGTRLSHHTMMRNYAYYGILLTIRVVGVYG